MFQMFMTKFEWWLFNHYKPTEREVYKFDNYNLIIIPKKQLEA